MQILMEEDNWNSNMKALIKILSDYQLKLIKINDGGSI